MSRRRPSASPRAASPRAAGPPWALLAVLCLVGLGGGLAAAWFQQRAAPLMEAQAESARTLGVPTAADPDIGRRTYAQCQVCHRPDGLGIPGTFPPLRASPWLARSEQAIRVVLHGFSSAAPGMKPAWPMTMPGLGDRLTDGEVAAVITYVRSAWTPAGSGTAAALPTDITIDQVAAIRAGERRRSAPWAPEELAALPMPSETPGAQR